MTSIYKSTKKDMVKFENYGLKVSVTTLLSCETFNPKTLAIDQRAKCASDPLALYIDLRPL